MAHLIPEIRKGGQLPVNLSIGERQVFGALMALDDDWTVYAKPTLGAIRPDFVATHASYGVCVIEVRDWQMGTYRQAANGALEVRTAIGWVQSGDSPRWSVDRHRNAIDAHFFADADPEHHDVTVVRGVVALPNLSTAEACELLRRPRMVTNDNWIKVWGGEELRRDPFCVVAGHPRPEIRHVHPAGLDRLSHALGGQGARVPA